MIDKRQERIKNYLDLIKSNKAYIRYVESFGEDNRINDCNLNRLKVAYAAFALLLWKDEYIKKDSEKNLSTIVVDKLLERYIANIASTNNEGKWQIGDIVFESNLEVIDKVRNKLAHGDYTVDRDFIYFEIDDKQGSIEISKLVSLVVSLGNDWEKMKEHGENTYAVLRNSNPYYNPNINIDSEDKLDKAIDNISYIEIKDKPKNGHIRDLQYIQMVYFLKEKVMKEVAGMKDVINLTSIPHIKGILDQYGIDSTITEIPAKRLPKIEQVKGMYLSKLNYLSKGDTISQQKYLTHWIYESEKESMTKKNVYFGLTSNQYYFQELEKNRSNSVVDVISKSSFGDFLAVLNEKNILSSYLTNFYITYIYGLDDVLNISNKDHILDVIEGRTFDFSKLDLSGINPIIHEEEHEYMEFIDQINKIDTDIEDTKDRISKVSNNLYYIKRDIDQGNDRKKDTYKELKEIETELLNRLQELIEKKSKCNAFMKTNFTTYRRNRSIIEHIRNSIAHGNISLNIFNGDYTLNDAKITLNDLVDGKSTFTLELTMEQFNNLCSDFNICQIEEFLTREERKAKLTK